jgi:hypothetical protein
MTTAAICEPGSLTRSDVLACVPHLRAFAAMLAGDHRRADDLVRDTIEQTFTAVNRPHAGIGVALAEPANEGLALGRLLRPDEPLQLRRGRRPVACSH